MRKLSLSNVDLEHFMAHHWQRQPVVIRQGFKKFKDLISPEDLAGLACEADVDSRLVYRQDGRWQAETGPFESYGHLGDKGWSLMVQAANHWSPEVAALVPAFAFIPKWRLDDVMVGYSTPEGGVGPHIDLYDVFICQGSGRRRWRVGDRGAHRQFAAHAALLHVEAFDAMLDVELAPGDILYIPPGFPHDGVSLETSMSYSVGFRAKSACEMLSGLADYVIDKDLGSTRLSDPARPIHTQQGHIHAADFQRMRSQLQSLLDDTTLIADFAGSFLSKTKCQLDLQALEDPMSGSDVLETLNQQNLIRTGGLRCFYLDATVEQGVCYVDGERYAFGPGTLTAVKALCDHDRLTHTQLRTGLKSPEFVAALTQWVNAGYWYFDDASE
ncbi:MAG: cupin domain-containing protein [Rhodoferax sp.]|nr:cupin domain-containing protein [Rhodoferax sp.]